MTHDPAISDRALGVVLGTAAGDALGAGYEFQPPVPEPTPIRMKGGGTFNWAPGEWTDDTSMAVPILRTVARGGSFDEATVLDGLVAAWADWARTAPDVGIQTRSVLGGLEARTASAAQASARRVHDQSGRSAGNGSLMRTAPLVLGFLGSDDEPALAAAARTVSGLTHFEADAGDGCVLWCLAIRHAVLRGELDVRRGLDALPAERRQLWADRLDAAEAGEPVDFTATNGWVVSALQAAYAAVLRTDSLADALIAAVRSGNDTDTVAAIAGGLAGGLYGAAALPDDWREVLHGWPGLRADDLVALSEQALERPSA